MPRQGFGPRQSRHQVPRQQGSQRQRQRTGAPRSRRRAARESRRPRPPDEDDGNNSDDDSSIDSANEVDMLRIINAYGVVNNETERRNAVMDALERRETHGEADDAVVPRLPSNPIPAANQNQINEALEILANHNPGMFDFISEDERSSNGGDENQDEEEVEDDNVDPNRNQFNVFVDEGSSSEGETEWDNLLSWGDNESMALSERADLESTSSGEVRIITIDSSSEEEESDEDDDAPICAICFLKGDQDHNWRRLMLLPCCGSNGKEATSSMRFCAACLLRLASMKLAHHDWMVQQPFPSDEYPIYPWQSHQLQIPERLFYQDDCQTDKRCFIDCPRCKSILVVNIKNPEEHRRHQQQQHDGNNGDWTEPKHAESISLRQPTFKGRCRYAGKKVGIARILWTIAFLNPNLLPLETFLATDADIRRLLTWRIIHRVPGKNDTGIFMMKKEDHSRLLLLLNFDRHRVVGTDGATKRNYDNLCNILFNGLWRAVFKQLDASSPISAVRLMIRILVYKWLHYFGILLFPCSEVTEWTVAATIICFVWAVVWWIGIPAVQFMVYFAMYALLLIYEFTEIALEFLFSIPPTTIVFGFACGILGFLHGQRHPNFTIAQLW